MYPKDRNESERDEDKDHSKRDQGRRLEDKEVEANHVPHRREAREIAFSGLRLAVGEWNETRQHDGDAGGHAGGFRQALGLAQGEGGDRHIGEVVDNEIETLAAPARQDRRNLDAAGERTVNGVDDQRDAKPEEHRLPVGVGRRKECEQSEARARRRQDMHQTSEDAQAHRQTSCRAHVTQEREPAVSPIVGGARLRPRPRTAF